ncbi:Thioesterase domain-containing protein [Rutstroemia sp. NJR-2017a WRK4]|nr:Thioesterase domain-containing protein [Rutstroemia sp. NJR-2017a WRK4]PQE11880.1 Thioesterase domain-containing protein [Rutstroemia sp. NJR-2017a WRK4]
MSPKKESSTYTPLSDIEDIDLENDSDTTLGSNRFPSTSPKPTSRRRSQHTSPKTTRIECLLVWVRWGSVIILQSLILFFLLKGKKKEGNDGGDSWSLADTETGGDINGLYVPQSHKWTLLKPEEFIFVPNMTSNDDRMAIRHNWDMLMPLGSGTVKIPDYEQHPMLGKPIVDDPIRSGPIFEASWTHALHCLYYTVDTYHQLVISNGTTFGFDGERNDMHASHCFEYLRNQILCMADMTLEGSESVLDATGEGQAHVCRNRQEAIEWIEGRRVDDIQSIVGP